MTIERRAQRPGEQRRALYSEDMQYRYLLEIVWIEDKPMMQSIALNPSTATETQDDPTIRRLKRFAFDCNFGGLIMTNAAALRETDRTAMLRHPEPIGPENTPQWLASLPAAMVVACWGASCEHPKLQAQIAGIEVNIGRKLHAFRLTQRGFPEHPLYLPASLRPRPLGALRQMQMEARGWDSMGDEDGN